MHALTILRRAASAVVGPIAQRMQGPEFSCGECERSDRCGRPPDADCIVRAMQIAADPTGYRRRMKARAALLSRGFWQ